VYKVNSVSLLDINVHLIILCCIVIDRNYNNIIH